VTDTQQLELAIIGEHELGEICESQTIESLDQFEQIFGDYESEFIGLPPGFGDRLLSYIRTKVSIPLSGITDKIKLRYEIEKTINDFLDEKTKLSKKENDQMIDLLLELTKKYKDVYND